jgi:transcriptional regulator with GAF, ATPase, and Fis domain
LAASNFTFQIGELAGRGASATVYRATERTTGRAVALKVGRERAEASRLADEAELLAFVDCTAVAQARGAGFVPNDVPEIGGLPYVALDWVDGAPLEPRRLDAAARWRTALVVARDIGQALTALHATGFAHGDVKPENLMMSAAGARAVLVDLGLGAKAVEASPRGGTLRYLAPESFETERTSDARSRDLYALGLVIAEVASEAVATSATPRDAALAVNLERLGAVVSALLSPAPGARPSADWVARRAREWLGESEAPAQTLERRRSAVRRAYLAVRRRELVAIGRGTPLDVRVAGTAGTWLAEAAALFSNIGELRDATAAGPERVAGDLDVLGRARFLARVVGPAAANWPLPATDSDGALVDRLLDRVADVEPASLTFADVLGEAQHGARESLSDDPFAIAVALGAGAPSAAVLDRAESMAFEPSRESVALALGRALRLSGQIGRALAVLGGLSSDDAKVEAAECARRSGDPGAARAFLDQVSLEGASDRVRARWFGTKGRLELDSAGPERSLAVVGDAPPSAPVLEVRALAALYAGDLPAARRDAERARALASNDEERARAEAVLGNALHAGGDASRALDAFRRATASATRAGALLEEATYDTGLAAAAFDAGELAECLAASTRAALLFEQLGRGREAARAFLARAAAFAVAGAAPLATEAAEQAIDLAESAGDSRCHAFAHLVIADVLDANDARGLAAAERAAGLVAKDGARDDTLRVAARRLRGGRVDDVAALDQLAEDPSIALPARLEWWGTRADLLSRERAPERPDRALSALARLASLPGPVPSRGEAFAAGAALAARTGDGEAARRFATMSADAARKLVDGAPPELKLGLLALPWVKGMRSPREASLLPEQIGDVESLVRALGTRDRLRPLLDQVLDALVLWTGVERGLLLLRAPGGRLSVRAARNIARHDLRGEQLRLSHSLAERALSSGEPVVAVDAAGELPEVHESVHALKLRSVLAVPLVARGEPLGVVYLDDRIRKGAFGPSELAWVRLVATLAAVAIADARDQLALRRSVRRAERAEARLADTLANREAKLDVVERELARASVNRTTRYTYDDVVGDSEPVRALLTLVDRVTPTEVPVLISGESGSGKELVARAIHKNGPRGGAAFVSENCGAIPETLLESTLFGHVRGAFTGASRPHAGLFEVADGGTLFLDEIGEMSLGMQTKLLRVLESGELRPVGSERARKVDVRVIAATHRNLAKMTETGDFRRDLFYRLNVIAIQVPALRERPSDIEPLARHFLAKHGKVRSIRLSHAALGCLTAYPWPGNIRELENELRRSLVLADDLIRPEHLSDAVRTGARTLAATHGLNVRGHVDALETDLVRAALERTGGNQTRAAELLGLSRFGLQKMIRRLKITHPSALSGRDDVGAVSGVR